MSNNIYLNSINYQRAEWLQEQVGGSGSLYRVLDAIIFTCQNSKFQEDGKRTACPGIERVAELAHVSVRTAQRHLQKLKDLGLIKTKIKKLYNGTTRCFFWLCDILFKFLKEAVHKKDKEPREVNKDAGSAKMAYPGSAKMADPYIERKNLKEKNTNNSYCYQNLASTQSNATSGYCVTAVTVNFQQVEKEVVVTQPPAKPTVQNAAKPTAKAKETNPYTIGDMLTKRQIAIAHGAVNNLIKNGVPVSNPKQLKSEVVFKIEQKHKDAGGNNLQHQINSAMKLIRSGKWTTPHWFYKYSEVGRKAAKKRVEAEKAAEANKHATSIPTLPDHLKDLLKLDLGGVGQGGSMPNANGQCDNADTRQNEPSVSGNNKAGIGGQVATGNDAAGTTNLSQDGSMGLSRSALDVDKKGLSAGENKEQTRADALTASIARYQDKLEHVKGEAKTMLMGLIVRCVDELKMLRFSCGK